ncbi:MAG: putative glutamine amidotransferase [Acidimicrobiales bacterium]|nr:putative glutamine amidotransferase [Acidimicrobiales bacterium]
MTTPTTPPVVAVTGRRLPVGRIEGWLEPAMATPAYYLEAVTRAGGIGAVLLPEPIDEAGAAGHAAAFAGLLLTGGADLDPIIYGALPVPETYGCDRLTDEWELALLRAFVAAGKPVLAICRGHQLLNVAYGGTLDQHITGRPGLCLHGIPNGGGGSDVDYRIAPGSRLAEALGTTEATGRCHHHQAVDVVGDGLVVSARAVDDVIEAVEVVGDQWILGVQWHPEDTAARDPHQQALFDRFVAETRL